MLGGGSESRIEKRFVEGSEESLGDSLMKRKERGERSVDVSGRVETETGRTSFAEVTWWMRLRAWIEMLKVPEWVIRKRVSMCFSKLRG